MHGTLKVHKITRVVEKNKAATLQFYCNSKSVNSFHKSSFSVETSLIVRQYYAVDYDVGVVTAVNENGSIEFFLLEHMYHMDRPKNGLEVLMSMTIQYAI